MDKKSSIDQKDFSQADEELIEHLEESYDLIPNHKGILKVKEDTVRLSDQTLSKRRYISHPGAVIIAGIIDSKFLLIRQYRHACRQVFWEFPCGKIDAEEEPLTAAKREFLEEGGYTATQWDFLGPIYPCIGYSSEKLSFYCAQDLHFVGQKLDEGEFLKPYLLTEEDINLLIHKGMLTDAKTLAALSYLAQRNLFHFGEKKSLEDE